ncbi:hypothetical protein ABT168_02760 [Streptomyces sp. NPDC001793]|uniref:hypothetical protein n=1 Tax=Streptomyces sp. NPDC001793 TaxID=3154657 RepID=UPI00331CFB7C
MRRRLRVLTISATLTLLAFGLAAPVQAASGGKHPIATVLTKVVGDLVGIDDY